MVKITEDNIDAIAAEIGAIPIQGGATGLFYLAHPNDKKRIAIAGSGVLILNAKQARALQNDLPGVFEEYCAERIT
jgi:hypothetical protein